MESIKSPIHDVVETNALSDAELKTSLINLFYTYLWLYNKSWEKDPNINQESRKKALENTDNLLYYLYLTLSKKYSEDFENKIYNIKDVSPYFIKNLYTDDGGNETIFYKNITYVDNVINKRFYASIDNGFNMGDLPFQINKMLSNLNCDLSSNLNKNITLTQLLDYYKEKNKPYNFINETSNINNDSYSFIVHNINLKLICILNKMCIKNEKYRGFIYDMYLNFYNCVGNNKTFPLKFMSDVYKPEEATALIISNKIILYEELNKLGGYISELDLGINLKLNEELKKTPAYIQFISTAVTSANQVTSAAIFGFISGSKIGNPQVDSTTVRKTVNTGESIQQTLGHAATLVKTSSVAAIPLAPIIVPIITGMSSLIMASFKGQITNIADINAIKDKAAGILDYYFNPSMPSQGKYFTYLPQDKKLKITNEQPKCKNPTTLGSTLLDTQVNKSTEFTKAYEKYLNDNYNFYYFKFFVYMNSMQLSCMYKPLLFELNVNQSNESQQNDEINVKKITALEQSVQQHAVTLSKLGENLTTTDAMTQKHHENIIDNDNRLNALHNNTFPDYKIVKDYVNALREDIGKDHNRNAKTVKDAFNNSNDEKTLESKYDYIGKYIVTNYKLFFITSGRLMENNKIVSFKESNIISKTKFHVFLNYISQILLKPTANKINPEELQGLILDIFITNPTSNTKQLSGGKKPRLSRKKIISTRKTRNKKNSKINTHKRR
jgi:hypothetical protein